MKNNLFNKYVQYIQYFEKMTCYEKNIIQQLNPNIIDENRILHYKTDLLLSLVLAIKDHQKIRFDAFAAFFDFHLIEITLTPFSLNQRFQLFEILLKNYIENFKKIEEKDFLYAYKVEDIFYALNEYRNVEKKEKEGILEYNLRKEKLELLESLFLHKGFDFQQAKDYLISLNINEHFAHFFLEYLQEKYQKRNLTAKKFIDYLFTGNDEFISYIQRDEAIAARLEEVFFQNPTHFTLNEKESTQLYYNILNILEGNYGENFMGYYSCIYSEMKYVKENDFEIYKVLLRALLNDSIYLKRKKKINIPLEYKELESVFDKNFSLSSFHQQNLEEITDVLKKIHMPPSFVDFFVQTLISSYEAFMKKNSQKIPVYKKVAQVEKIKKEETFDPFEEEDLKEKKVMEILFSLFSLEEKEKFFQAIHYLSLNNSAIKGYCEQLNVCISHLKEIAEEVLNNPSEKEVYQELFHEEMDTLDEIFYQINMVIPYKLTKKTSMTF